MPPAPSNGAARHQHLNEDDLAARLSFVSTSTGYSSARSSPRSSDGADDQQHNRDSGIITSNSSTYSFSSNRRSALLAKGSLTKLDRIAIELLDTEKCYVEDLFSVIRGYLNFLVDNREALRITLDDVSALFGCIEKIHELNRKLLQKLDSAELDCIKMAKCFLEMSGKFEDYVVYCTNYHKMVSTLLGLQQHSQLQSALQERQLALGHSLPLAAYLLKPVQRVLKYHLFLENMLKNLSSSTSPEDFDVVKQAHEVMTCQAARINDEKRKIEHAERVDQLQAAIHKWKIDKSAANLSAYGELLLEASMRQAGSKTMRLIFLFEEMLLIVKQRANSYTCKDYIMCSNLMLNESICADEPLAFQVLSFDNPKAAYIFLANSTDQKRIWMTELKRMMLDHYAVEIPEKTKQLMLSMDNTQPSKMISFGRPEFAEVSLKNHKKVPKYLEKRRKSVEQANVQARRRSLSASRLLGSNGSKTSVSATNSIYTDDGDEPRCTCHLGQSTSDLNAHHSNRSSVSRTVSAAAIDLDDISMIDAGNSIALSSQPISENVLSSRSRFHQARNKKHLPPRHSEIPSSYRSVSSRRIAEEEIEKTFDQLYKELVSFGDTNKPSSGMHSSSIPLISAKAGAIAAGAASACTNRPDSVNAVKRLDELVSQTRKTEDRSSPNGNRTETDINRLRSKSLTRLDDSPLLIEPPKQIERRYSKLDNAKRKSRKYTVCQDPDHSEEIRIQCAVGRQRTPLTVEQAAELDHLNAGGIVSHLLRRYENVN
ncbi:hypothetical protein WR25_02180 [Diploscapter pachys]|uniref:DH domain-containing protein n=1 Tax=Diploscapter pachys TaxID=2018661 RepID=A0A2A2KQM1_9BILA|nr:hypothetical protein WR25_02180 [Diploscapter pachys]